MFGNTKMNIPIRPVARCLMCMYACMSMEDYRGVQRMLPPEMFRNQIPPEAILGQQQSYSSYSLQKIAFNFLAAICAHAKPVDIEFPQENGRTAGVVTVVTGGEIVVRRALKMYNQVVYFSEPKRGVQANPLKLLSLWAYLYPVTCQRSNKFCPLTMTWVAVKRSQSVRVTPTFTNILLNQDRRFLYYFLVEHLCFT